MFSIALTGTRFSGKTSVSKLFKKIHIPVFHADTVMKFLFNYKDTTKDPLISNVGSFIYRDGFLDPDSFVTDSLVDRAIDVIEYELLKSWEMFKLKHNDKPYVIFESSILFERGWEKHFDKVICVFAPKEERVYRAKMEFGARVDYLWQHFSKEIPELTKNKMSDYVIHNYESAPDIISQVNNIDKKIVDEYIIKGNLKHLKF